MSVEEGLLLLANPLCELILRSCLTRALALHYVQICHFVIEATHVHMLIVVYDPSDVPLFVERFKTESAHMLNRILGRRKRTIWCEGYDSPVILTLARAMMFIAYLYSNPAKDNLVESIEEFPGLSSWNMYRSGVHTEPCRIVRRSDFRELAPREHNLRSYANEAERIRLLDPDSTKTFSLEPNAWMEALDIESPAEQRELNESIVQRVRTLESRARSLREKSGKRVMGAHRLRNERINAPYRSERSGKRMWVLTEDRDLRIQFIQHLKYLVAEARRIRQRWRVGDLSEAYPLGLYPPSMPRLADTIAVF